MIIVYCSATGFTEQYARLLHDKTGLPCMPLAQAERELAAGSSVVFLGWLMAGSIQGLKKARKQFDVRLICGVGMASAYDLAELARQNATGDLPLFYLRGGYDRTRLKGVYKVMMSVMEKAIRGKAAKDEQGREMLEAVEHGANWVTDEQLAPVTAYLNT